MGKVSHLSDAREAKIDRDSDIAKRLITQAIRVWEQMTSVLTIWAKEINDPEQLKALVDIVKQIAHDTIVDAAIEIEVARNLYRIELPDNIQER